MQATDNKANSYNLAALLNELPKDREEALRQLLAATKSDNIKRMPVRQSIEPIPTRVRAGVANIR